MAAERTGWLMSVRNMDDECTLGLFFKIFLTKDDATQLDDMSDMVVILTKVEHHIKRELNIPID